MCSKPFQNIEISLEAMNIKNKAYKIASSIYQCLNKFDTFLHSQNFFEQTVLRNGYNIVFEEKSSQHSVGSGPWVCAVIITDSSYSRCYGYAVDDRPHLFDI